MNAGDVTVKVIFPLVGITYTEYRWNSIGTKPQCRGSDIVFDSVTYMREPNVQTFKKM